MKRSLQTNGDAILCTILYLKVSFGFEALSEWILFGRFNSPIMKYVAKTTSALTGTFFFLATLLFNSSAIGAFVSDGKPSGSPIFIIVGTICAMAVFALLFLFLDRIASRFARLLTMLASILLPILSLILLLIPRIPVSIDGIVSLQLIPSIVIIVMGAAAISQIHCFARETVLNSRGLFLASGLSIAAAVLLSYIAFSTFDNPSYGVMLIACIMTVSGMTTIIGFQSKPQPHKDEQITVGNVAPEEKRQGFGEIAVLALPLILISLFCTLALGQTWKDRLFAEFDSQCGLFLLVLAVSLGFVLLVYRYWKQMMDIDAFLVGLVVPLILPVLVIFFENLIPSSWIAAMLMLSQILYLLFAWTSVLLIGRIVSTSDSITPGFIIVFLVLYAVFMSLPQIQDTMIVSRFITLASLGLLVYLLFYFFHKANSPAPCQEAPPMEMNKALKKRCENAARQYGLSPRESELLPMLAVGFSASVIGRRVFISDHTVKTHRYHIYQKIGVRNHEELVEKLDLVSMGPQN
jgi:DNA-binding CsgD family transcriptional regulator